MRSPSYARMREGERALDQLIKAAPSFEVHGESVVAEDQAEQLAEKAFALGVTTGREVAILEIQEKKL